MAVFSRKNRRTQAGISRPGMIATAFEVGATEVLASSERQYGPANRRRGHLRLCPGLVEIKWSDDPIDVKDFEGIVETVNQTTGQELSVQAETSPGYSYALTHPEPLRKDILVGLHRLGQFGVSTEPPAPQDAAQGR